MSLIEQAAKRLEQIRQAGGSESAPAPDRAAIPAPRVADAPAPAVVPHQVALPAAATPGPGVKAPGRSKRVEIDLRAMAASRLVTPDAPRSQIAEEYRVIKRPLIDNAMGRGAAPIPYGNLIMVSSALPREGKSFTAVNLAMSIATELNNTVMLVDADVARPSVLRMLGLPPSQGLLDVLTNDVPDVAGVLLRTNIENLTILPGGTAKEHATELLASEAMSRLLDEMSRRYADRIIVFDSPPLLLTTEARTLATHMGQIVLVVRAEQTSHAEVKQALAAIESCDVKLLLLNQARSQAGDGYGYGYGYGYGASMHHDASRSVTRAA